MPATQVFDSHALLQLLRDEPGAEAVAQILEKAGARDHPVHMTEVNYAEVQYMIRRKDGDAAWQTIAGELVATPIQFHPADRALADTAADFALSSATLFLLAIGLAAQVRLELGHWPRPMWDDYRTSAFDIHWVLLIGVGFFALYGAIPLWTLCVINLSVGLQIDPVQQVTPDIT